MSIDILDMRRAIHQFMDPLWEKCIISRDALYADLSAYLGREAHVSEMSEKEIRDCIGYIMDTYYKGTPCSKCKHKIAVRFGIPICGLGKEKTINGKCGRFDLAGAV